MWQLWMIDSHVGAAALAEIVAFAIAAKTSLDAKSTSKLFFLSVHFLSSQLYIYVLWGQSRQHTVKSSTASAFV